MRVNIPRGSDSFSFLTKPVPIHFICYLRLFFAQEKPTSANPPQAPSRQRHSLQDSSEEGTSHIPQKTPPLLLPFYKFFLSG